MSVTVDPPSSLLIVDHLSANSIGMLAKCPTKWKKYYVDGEREPATPRMVIGGAVGAAEGQSFEQKIDTGELMGTDQVLDLVRDEWAFTLETEDIDTTGEKPGPVLDSGIEAARQYHTHVAPSVEPIAVERQFDIGWAGVDWTVRGYIDVEQERAVRDLKVKAKRMTQQEADSSLQASLYALARREEAEAGHLTPIDRFLFDVLVRKARPEAYELPTTRTDAQLDATVDRVFAAASEIHWRLEHDVWSGAPEGAWWCSERFCGFWSRCKFGGAR